MGRSLMREFIPFVGVRRMCVKQIAPGIHVVFLVMALLFASEVAAVDYGLSGFATLGGAISDHDIAYQRYLDNDGTLMRDSLLGVQLDVKFNDQWAATTQVVLASATDEDNTLKPQVKWTFLSYRPNNDWLLRLGRLSLGGLLNQQNLDVGVSYDMLRLPNEVYLLSSAYDYDGLSIAKTWSNSEFEITIDGSLGMQQRDYRVYKNGSRSSGFYSGDVTGGGFVLTVTDYGQTIYRLGWNIDKVEADSHDGFLTGYNFIPLGGGKYTMGMPT